MWMCESVTWYESKRELSKVYKGQSLCKMSLNGEEDKGERVHTFLQDVPSPRGSDPESKISEPILVLALQTPDQPQKYFPMMCQGRTEFCRTDSYTCLS